MGASGTADMSLLKEIAAYSARPFFTAERDRFSPEYLIKLTLLTTALALLVIIVASVLLSILGIEIPEQSDVFKTTPKTQLLFLAVIVAPILEETIFRSWLGSHGGIRTALPIIAAFFFILTFVGFSSPHATPILIILIGALIFYFTRIRPRLGEDFINGNFKYYFWISSIVFGLIHLSNYDMQSFNPALTLLILPQLIAGFIFGYTRMRFGVLACMFTHGFYNGTVFLLMSLFG